MWLRTVDLRIASDQILIRHEAAAGPVCTLEAALLRWNGPTGSAGRPPAEIIGLAWRGTDGDVLWGWPDESGQVSLRPSSGSPRESCILPLALSIALAFRRSGIDLGSRTLVLGGGFLGRVAGAVAKAAGCRVVTSPGGAGPGADQGIRPEMVIEATGDPDSLVRALECCRDWGRVFSLTPRLTTAPLDYYPQVHMRALSLTHVPPRPILAPGEEEVAERGTGVLLDAVRGLAPAADETRPALIDPEGVPGRLSREAGGWALLVAGEG